jgi:L-aminopeptidase/D-esterase-like protein
MVTRRVAVSLAAVGLVAAAVSVRSQGARPAGTDTGITMVPGVRVGHHTLAERPTGCTVVLFPPNTVGAIHQPGGAPGTAETDLLRPENTVSVVHAILLSGGSSFGLDARGGVMKYLEEQKIGFAFGGAYVPIVPAAILFDLRIGDKPEIRPDARCGYEAARSAASGAVAEGSVGAGAGATVGKIGNPPRPMKGGIGTASLAADGLIVGAIVAANAAGSIVDRRTGRTIAGSSGSPGASQSAGLLENTTLAVVVTNATLTKAQALKVAQMAASGFSRSIVPAFTTRDGDTLFALGTGSLAGEPDVTRIGAMAADAVSDAIERAVKLAKGVPGYPGLADVR